MDLGRIGIWTFQLDGLAMTEARDRAAALDELGFGALWVPEAVGRESVVTAALLLGGCEHLVVATGVSSIWWRTPQAMNAQHRTVTAAYPERFLLGLGVSHGAAVEGLLHLDYSRPLTRMRDYLDAMDASLFLAQEPDTPPRRVLAALGPRMLELAAQRAEGVLSYFVPVEHTGFAREALDRAAQAAGRPRPLLAVEQAVVFETDPTEARRIARTHTGVYMGLPNYTNNLKRFGFTDDDMADGGSDRLVDAVVAWGDDAAVHDRVRAHLDAGADHVCVQVLPPDQFSVPDDAWRRLAEVVL
jgi:probable F420-dependent oxidoreductase